MRKWLSAQGFEDGNIIVLKNQQATGDAILINLRHHLIDSAKAGDVSLLFFAGHGSRIRNLALRDEEAPGRMDTAIVPYDAPLGVPALRNKELAAIYKGVPAGVSLTVIQDNCYSGGGARGLAPPLATREAPDDARVVNDPPLWPPVDQQANPVLVIAASAPDQPAEEVVDENGVAHGRFTAAFVRALGDSLPGENAQAIFQRTRAYMHAGNSMQEPVLLGRGRGELTLLGEKALAADTITPSVIAVTGYTVRLDRGRVTGLREGCELRQAGAARGRSANPAVRLRVTELRNADEALAAPLEGTRIDDIHAGDRFVVDRWITSAEPPMAVYLPPAAPPLAELRETARAVHQQAIGLGLEWVTEPTAAVPDWVARWDGSAWQLYGADGKRTALGKQPEAERLAAVVKRKPAGRFFLELPPPAEWLAAGVGVGDSSANPGIAVNRKSAASAQYMLVGRLGDGEKIEYAWVAPNQTEASAGAAWRARGRQNLPLNVAMPLHSAWTDSGSDAGHPPHRLTELVLRLAKIRGWLVLQAAAPLEAPFPYRLALKSLDTGRINENGILTIGEHYQGVLEGVPEELAAFLRRYADAPAGVPKYFVYVFAIDQEGTSTLLFPQPADNGVVNHLPVPAAGGQGPSLPQEIAVSPPIEIAAPAGVDTYYLLVTATALGDPSVLESGALTRRVETHSDALGGLLEGVGTGTRGLTVSSPAEWSVDRAWYLSVEARKP
jgi:Caspase domain